MKNQTPKRSVLMPAIALIVVPVCAFAIDGGAMVSDMCALRNGNGFVIGFGANVGTRTGSVVARCARV